MKRLIGLVVAVLGLGAPAGAASLAGFQDSRFSIYQDAGDTRLLRQTDLTSLLRGNPSWIGIADVAALGATENKDWRLQSFDCLPPAFRQCLLLLAEAGKAGITLREYDASTRRFVDGGFALPPGQTQAAWYDDNRIIVSANAGPGTVTAGGTPRLLKLWTRGEPIYNATTILAAPLDAAIVRPVFSLTGGGLFHAAEVTLTNGSREIYHFGWAQNFRRPTLPPGAQFLEFFQGRAIVRLTSEWRTSGVIIASGSIIAYPIAPLLGPTSRTIIEVAYTPTPGASVVSAKAGRDTLYMVVRGASGDRLVALRMGEPTWPSNNIDVPGKGPMSLLAASTLADVVLAARSSATTESLYVAGHGRRARAITP